MTTLKVTKTVKAGFKPSIKSKSDIQAKIDLLGRLKLEADKRLAVYERGVAEIKLLDPKCRLFEGEEYKLRLVKTSRSGYSAALLEKLVPAATLRKCLTTTSYQTAEFTPISAAAIRMHKMLAAAKKETRAVKQAGKTK